MIQLQPLSASRHSLAELEAMYPQREAPQVQTNDDDTDIEAGGIDQASNTRTFSNRIVSFLKKNKIVCSVITAGAIATAIGVITYTALRERSAVPIYIKCEPRPICNNIAITYIKNYIAEGVRSGCTRPNSLSNWTDCYETPYREPASVTVIQGFEINNHRSLYVPSLAQDVKVAFRNKGNEEFRNCQSIIENLNGNMTLYMNNPKDKCDYTLS